MARRTALMEWIDQTRKIDKEEAYFGLAIVDTLLEYVWLIDGDKLQEFKDIVTKLCKEYHKEPNPFDLFGDMKAIEAEFKRTNNGRSLHKWKASKCRLCKEKRSAYRECRMYSFMQDVVTEQLKVQLGRYIKARQVILWQWLEIADLCWERPELIDVKAVGEYVETQIAQACKESNKKNPFAPEVRHLLGKYWRDKDGHLKRERRKRF